MNLKTRNSYIKLAIIIVMIIVYLLFFRKQNKVNSSERNQRIDHREKVFRHPSLYFTKHAKCRMECRHIDESEVKEILEEGEINYTKSETDANPCPKYAIEGITHDKQHVRIIVGDCKTETSIITVIDLENEFECDCK